MLQGLQNFDASKIILSNKQECGRIPNPINGLSHINSGFSWDSEIGRVDFGFEISDPDRAFLIVHHNEIPSHVLAHHRAGEKHHWGFLGVYEFSTDFIMKPSKGLFAKGEIVSEAQVLSLVRELFDGWKHHIKANRPPLEVPCCVSGEDLPYSKVRELPDPNIDIETLPIEHHENRGVKVFSNDPARIFHYAREIDGCTTFSNIYRIEAAVSGWYDNGDGTWEETTMTSTRYMSENFAHRASRMYKKLLAHEADSVAREARRVAGGLGRTFV